MLGYRPGTPGVGFRWKDFSRGTSDTSRRVRGLPSLGGLIMARPSKHPEELRERAVGMVAEVTPAGSSAATAGRAAEFTSPDERIRSPVA